MFHGSEYIKQVLRENSDELNNHLCHAGLTFSLFYKGALRLHIMWKNQAGNKAARGERGGPGNDPFQAAIRQAGGCGK